MVATRSFTGLADTSKRGSTDLPLVSIIIPCYNAEEYVAEAIQSALDQAYPNCEVIVIDDGSNDGSLEEIKRFGDKIRWETGPNRGGCAARNRGFEISAGSFVQFFDADDLLHHQRIEILMMAMTRHEDADFAWAPNMKFVGRQIPKSFFSQQNPESVPIARSKAVLQAAYAPSASLFRRSFLEKVGGWNESLQRWVDLEYHGRITLQCRSFVVTDIPLYGYRQHGGDRISNANKTHENLDSALASLSLTREALEASRVPQEQRDAYLLPFFIHIARSAAAAGRKDIFQQCIEEALKVSKSRRFRVKALLASTMATVFGIRPTSFVLERSLPPV